MLLRLRGPWFDVGVHATGKPIKKPVKFVREGQTVFVRMKVDQAICVETFQDFDQFGRFMLRDEGAPNPLAPAPWLRPRRRAEETG